ncbi:HlyD family secretion protein [Rhodoblastus acidophilus]|uniref:HlyD family type I secretion periplasmic adaptor subunit n=1 Tax=Rhodoblastus acidophilus TaxID=1074 RepID=UPI002225663D|nr:HlyD family type I secretion periplasmic adaptor subunit [Rhodoblastus acidophilus]MCW2285761.1 HlyD family secretion protein [Rhodoblastus acidophilus]MCW2333416.1 HlyD family secretion protein [Rhodoblastus acidophilus]
MSKNALATVRSFQSEIAAIREAPEPLSARITLHVLAAMIVVFVALLFFMRIDRVVGSVGGKVTVSTARNVFQALDTSIIKSIDVRPGDTVKKGQVLATLDPTFAAADVTQLKQQIASLNPQILRDEAELSGKPPVFPASSDPTESKYNELQKALYAQRVAQYAAQINSYREKEKQIEATIVKTNNDIARIKERVEIAAKVEEMRNKLLASGAGSLLNQLASKDQRVEQMRAFENMTNSLKEAEAQLSSVRADREAFIQQWSTQISQDLVTARNNRDNALAQLEKAQKHQDLVQITAAEDSIILTVAKLSVGSVLSAGADFITAMPVGVPVAAEVNVLTRDIGFVRVGDPATLKVDAFDFTHHGYAEGRVKWITEGAFTVNEDTNQPTEPYYRVGIAIENYHFVKVPDNFRLMPGMTLVADIKVGSRSAGAYLMEGMLRGVSGAMREP